MYKGVGNIFARYWRAYGGLRALLCSPYFHLAILVLLPLTHHTWSETGWWADPLAALPNLLGFTLAGFAMFIGFGDDRFRSLLASPDEDASSASAYVQLCAAFVHFIVVQILAIIVAVIGKGLGFYAEWMNPVRSALPTLNALGGMVGYALFLYSLTSVVAATMHVFRIATIYEIYQRKIDDQPPSGSE